MLSDMELLALAALDEDQLIETLAHWAWSRRDNIGDKQIGASKSRINRLICEARIPTQRRAGLAAKVAARAKEQMDAEVTKWFLKLKPEVLAAKKHTPYYVGQIIEAAETPKPIRPVVYKRLFDLRTPDKYRRQKPW